MFGRRTTSLLLADRFSTEDKARQWFEDLIWPNSERHCPNCGSIDTHEASHPKMPYRCREYIGVTQKTAWFMQKWIREAFADQGVQGHGSWSTGSLPAWQ